jgi:beta-glucanase (GH16 family)
MRQTSTRRPALAVAVAVAAVVALAVAFVFARSVKDGVLVDGHSAAPGHGVAPGTATDPETGMPVPAGPDGNWKLVFSDEFDGGSLDHSRWADVSSAEADDGHGNKDNEQLEWNRAANCAVSEGQLVMTARREPFRSPSGTAYGWTSCLLSSEPSFAFQYGYVEERAVLPAPKGFWPAFWTWQAPGVETHVETDVYEFYSSEPDELQLTQHSGRRSGCTWRPTFDPTTGWHTYGASIEPSGTRWYVDGAEVCRAPVTSNGQTNIVSNLAVHAPDPPAGDVTSAVKRVDYIRAWQRP